MNNISNITINLDHLITHPNHLLIQEENWQAWGLFLMVDAGLGQGCVYMFVAFDFLDFTGFTQKRPRISGGVVQRTSCDIYPSCRRGQRGCALARSGQR